MVGSTNVRRLEREEIGELLVAPRFELDLIDQAAGKAWIRNARPDTVFVPAAQVGGILANNTQPADFLCDNLMIASNVIHAGSQAGVEKLLSLGSSCIYPRLADQPNSEDALLTGTLEPINERRMGPDAPARLQWISGAPERPAVNFCTPMIAPTR
jgi:GDP-L-fucose synthase